MPDRQWHHLIFIVIVLAITGGGHYYIWARLVRDVGWSQTAHRVLTVLLALLYLSLPLTFWLSRALPPNRGQLLIALLYLWFAFAVGLPLMLLVADLLRSIYFAGRTIAGLPELGESRRLFLQRSIASFVGLTTFGMTAAGVSEVRKAISVKRRDIALAKLPARLDGLVIVQLSDLHIGPTLREAFVSEVIARTNALHADLVVITGDLVDGSVAQLGSLVAPLARLKAKLGVYFVPGNHEYYSGVDEWLAFLPTLGIRVLRNESVTIGSGDDSLVLAGLDDEHASQVDRTARPDLDLALHGRDPSREVVLLAHQPKAVFRAQKRDVGLVLAGHTHGGQVWPFGWFVLLQQPVVAGLARFGRTQIYVNSGTGYWGPPLRVGTPAEITRIVLRSERRELLT